jgi:calmodulin
MLALASIKEKEDFIYWFQDFLAMASITSTYASKSKRKVKRGKAAFSKDKKNAKGEREIPRNSSGGILVTDDELERAFHFFDIEKTGQITSSNLRERLNAFAGTINAKEIRFLLNGKPHLTMHDLREQLHDNEVKTFDPYIEAFHWFDPQDNGYMDLSIVKRAFRKLGFGDINEEEIIVLLETADLDRDGKISLADFQSMLITAKPYAPSKEDIGDGQKKEE